MSKSKLDPKFKVINAQTVFLKTIFLKISQFQETGP